MKTRLEIQRVLEGTLDELMATHNLPPIPTIDEVLLSLRNLTFIVETIAHLSGKGPEMLPTTEKARKLIARLEE